MKKTLAVMLSGVLALSGATVFAVGRESETRVELASFVFDATGQTPGEKVTQYLAEELPKTINYQDYQNCYENGVALLYNVVGVNWSDNVCEEYGLQPQTYGFTLKIDSAGWQNIDLSFDMGTWYEVSGEEQCEMYLYNNNAHEMMAWAPIELAKDKMAHYHLDFTGHYVEDIYGKYNEIYISFGAGVPLVFNNIKITGVKADEDGRAYYYGDADADKKLTIADATQLQKFSIGIDDDYFNENYLFLNPFTYCDVNGDNRISILDVTCIQKYLADYPSGTGKTGERVVLDYPPEWYEDAID